jgi:hypothetical protein
MTLAPIVLFVYNRPWHTQQTLEALAKNDLADQSKLYIYADGAKADATEDDLKKISEVEELIHSRKWCGDLEFIKRDHNYGLADNIVDGVTTIVNKYGKIIVLEDDIVTSPGFLKYMNDALDLYENEDKVMHISGYMFPVKKKLPSTFFYQPTTCWGWGTWSRSWSLANFDSQYLLEKFIDAQQIQDFNINNTYPFFTHLRENALGTMKTWAVRWYANVFINNGFSLHPFPSLVNNIGNDGLGENCGTSNKYDWNNLAEKNDVGKVKIKQNRKALYSMQHFNNGNKTNICKKIITKAKSVLKNYFF